MQFFSSAQGTQQPLGAMTHLHSASFYESSHKVAQSNQPPPNMHQIAFRTLHGFHRAPHFAHSLCIYTWDFMLQSHTCIRSSCQPKPGFQLLLYNTSHEGFPTASHSGLACWGVALRKNSTTSRCPGNCTTIS